MPRRVRPVARWLHLRGEHIWFHGRLEHGTAVHDQHGSNNGLGHDELLGLSQPPSQVPRLAKHNDDGKAAKGSQAAELGEVAGLPFFA